MWSPIYIENKKATLSVKLQGDMLVWLPIVLIFDKLLVISAREGLSGIPGQPTTCPRDYKSEKFDRCNSHKLN